MNDDQQPEPIQPAPRPVAYDAEGQPLYAAPPQPETHLRDSHVRSAPEAQDGQNFDPRMRVQYGNEPDVVHHTRQHEPELLPISKKLQERHEASKEKYPGLNLSEGEYVIRSVRRHPIGLIVPVAVTVATILSLLAVLMVYPEATADANGAVPHLLNITIILLCLIILVGLGGYAAVWVYMRNALYLTNESIIQEIQHSVFSHHEQTVSLGSVEDASYRQIGIIQTALNYGSIRLSTEGDETKYRFNYVKNPKEELGIINNAIEAFKNGRPVVAMHDD